MRNSLTGLAVALSLVSFHPSDVSAEALRYVDGTQPEVSFKAKADEIVRIGFPARPGIGETWLLASALPPGVEETAPSEFASNQIGLGAGSILVFSFRFRRNDKIKLSFTKLGPDPKREVRGFIKLQDVVVTFDIPGA